MANQKIRFKMSLKEVSFEFEGDLETGQRIQAGINKTLNSLTQQPERLLPGFEEPIPVESKPVAENGENGKKSRSPRKSRVKAHTPRAQIVALRGDGFFDVKRGIAAIRTALSNKGHNFESNEIAASLTPLVKKGVLVRDKVDGSTFEYAKGPNDDDSGNAEDAE